jgi:hypothetical protein
MKLIDILRKPAPATLMAAELDDARRALLEAQSARDYATAMVAYHERRIDRLRATLELEANTGAEQRAS